MSSCQKPAFLGLPDTFDGGCRQLSGILPDSLSKRYGRPIERYATLKERFMLAVRTFPQAQGL